jgi:O-antigen/teichoic acid export membrane protein
MEAPPPGGISLMQNGAAGRVLKNFGVVLRGRGIAAILTLSATALMANALTATEFGLVILLHTYVLAVRGILNFRTYEAIVRFGVPLHENGDDEGLKKLFRTTTFIDLTSAVAATSLGVAAASIAGGFLHWDEQMISLAGLYSLVMLTTFINTPNGILRLYDRFDALSVFYTVGPTVRITGVLLAWYLDAGMHVFIAVWAAAFVLENCWLIARGRLELKKHISGSLWKGAKWRGIEYANREFRQFIMVVYWQTNIDLLPKHLSVLLAGNLLGPAAAGMFRLARDFSSVLSKPAMMLREVLFPDLTRILHTEATGFHELGYRAVKVAGAAGLLLVLVSIPAAGPILGIIGPEYTGASTLLTLMLLAATFELAGSPLRAAAYAMGKVAPVLRIHLLSVLIYLGLFYVLTPVMGLSGPGLAACTGTLMTLVLMFKLVRYR